MKTIDIEKVLDLQGAIDLLPITMKESFAYQQEEDGIRCVGPFFIRGRYTTINEVKDFQDVFEFDVFASNDKLDGEDFKIVYDGYDYSLEDEVILTLHFSVYGIKDDKEESIFNADDLDTFEEPLIDSQTYAHQDIEVPVFNKAEKPQNALEQQVEVNREEMSQSEDDQSVDFSMMEELFEEKDNVITSYSFVVVKQNDNYDTIATRYGVDVEALKGVNNNKEIHEKSLIVLPYAK